MTRMKEIWKTSSRKWEFCHLGSFLTKKYIKFVGLQAYLKMKWSLKDGFDIKKTDHGVHIFQFNHRLDIHKVLDGSSWSFKRHLLSLTRWRPQLSLKEISFLEVNC